MLAAYAGVGMVSIVTIRVVTGLAPPAVFGEASLLLGAVSLAAAIAAQPFIHTQSRYHSVAEAEGRGDAYTRAALAGVLAAGAGVYALVVLAWLVLRTMGRTSLGPSGVAALAVLILAACARSVLYGRVQAERRMFSYGGLLVGEAALIGGSTAIGVAASASVNGYVIGHAAGFLLAVLLALAVAPRSAGRLLGGRERAWEYLGQVRTYGAPFAPIGLLSWLANQADRYVLAALAGPAAAGRYVAPFAIASRGMSLAGSALGDVLRPVLFASVNQGETANSRKILLGWLGLRTLIAIVSVPAAWWLGPLISNLLLAPAYRQGAPLILAWIAGAYSVQGVIQTLETWLMVQERTGWLIAPLALGGLANLGFSLWLVPRFGAVGAAQATTASFLVQGAATVALIGAAGGSDPGRRPA
jgi:O-antigen/teichoic acid export membrane protein